MSLPPEEIRYEEKHITDNEVPNIIAANVVCFVVAFVAVVLRIISRRLKHLSFRNDDYMAVIALVLAAGLLANTFVSIHFGAGKHIILSRDPVAFAKNTIAAEVIYATGVVPVKLSLIFLYHHIFPNRPLHIALWIVGTIVVCMGIAADFLAIFSCVPVNATWDPTVKGRCINFHVWITIHGAQNVVTDFALLCLPMPLVWGLNMSRSRKIQVTGIFILGAFASVASLIRITYLHNVSLTDSSWANAKPNIWSMAELSMGITSVCLPTLGPIASLIRHGRSSSNYPSGKNSGSDRTAPNPHSKGSKRKSQSHLSWISMRPKRSDSCKEDGSFSKLSESNDESADDIWRIIAPFARSRYAEGTVEANARRSSSAQEKDRPHDGIKVTTDLQQDTPRLEKIEDV